MQIKIVMHPLNKFTIPLNYNHQVQSAIYVKLREVGESDFWHDTGFKADKLFKAFVFGSLNGDHTVENKYITFNNEISLEIRSPMLSLCDAFQRSIELNPMVKLFDTKLEVVGASMTNQHINGTCAVFSAESPVVIYSTEESHHTHFYGPSDECFVQMITDNYRRKYTAIFGMNPPNVIIEPIGSHKKVVTNFKGTWINGWKGKYRVTGEYRSLEFLYNAGLGSKNSQGFGMLKLEPPKILALSIINATR